MGTAEMNPSAVSAAIDAAASATAAASELLRFATKGDCASGGTFPFALEPETLGQLASSLRQAMEVERPAAETRNDDAGVAAIIQLSGALERFLEEWGA